jgi:hypothetical protein
VTDHSDVDGGGTKGNRENRRTQRVILKKPLRVVMGSIGANIRYDMETKNVSITGFFLEFEKPGRFPFTPSSIMEVWLELEKNKTIFFNGKMARVVLPDDPRVNETGPGIAIKIVQIDKENENSLKAFIDKKLSEVQSKKE